MDFKLTKTVAPVIVFDEKALSKHIDELIEKYANIESVTVENKLVAKKDLAAIRKLTKAINDKRIEAVKDLKKPLDEFEQKVGVQVKRLKEIIDPLDKGIKQVEEVEKIQKRQMINHFILNALEESQLPIIFADKVVFDEKWLNISTSQKQIKADIMTQLEPHKRLIEEQEKNVQIMMQSIKNLNEEYRLENPMQFDALDYPLGFDLMKGLDRVRRQAKFLKESQDAVKRKAEEEAKAIRVAEIEAQRIEAEEEFIEVIEEITEPIEEPIVLKLSPDDNVIEVKFEEKEPIHEPIPSPDLFAKPEPVIVKAEWYKIKVYGERDIILKLAAYMKTELNLTKENGGYELLDWSGSSE